jgi:hypothetical protein
MAESLKTAVSGDCEKATEPPASDVLEKDALDRTLGAEGENLTERRRTQLRHGSIVPEEVAGSTKSLFRWECASKAA